MQPFGALPEPFAQPREGALPLGCQRRECIGEFPRAGRQTVERLDQPFGPLCVLEPRLDARRRGKWLLNTSNCFSYQRPCEYLPFCQSGFNPNVADNLYEIVPPHEELTPADSEAPVF